MDEESTSNNVDQNGTKDAPYDTGTISDSPNENGVSLLDHETDRGPADSERPNCSEDESVKLLFVPECENEEKSIDTLSDSDDSVIFCSDPEVTVFRSDKIEKPKDLLAEISEILVSLSDDEQFLECINFSSKNGVVFDEVPGKRRSSVDLIFTYNILSILYNKLKELKVYFELTQLENRKYVVSLI